MWLKAFICLIYHCFQTSKQKIHLMWVKLKFSFQELHLKELLMVELKSVCNALKEQWTTGPYLTVSTAHQDVILTPKKLDATSAPLEPSSRMLQVSASLAQIIQHQIVQIPSAYLMTWLLTRISIWWVCIRLLDSTSTVWMKKIYSLVTTSNQKLLDL